MESSSAFEVEDREDISQNDQANVFFKSHLRRFYAEKKVTERSIE